MTWPIPTPSEQKVLLSKVQDCLVRGRHTASYKFALFQSLADLALLKDDDSGSPLTLRTKDIAANFVKLYWRQFRPYPILRHILCQETRRRPLKIMKIQEKRCGRNASLSDFNPEELGSKYGKLLDDVDQNVIRKDVLALLTKLPNEPKETPNFLYRIMDNGMIELRPKVAYWLRASYESICAMVREKWRDFVKKTNFLDNDHDAELTEFLFGAAPLGEFDDTEELLTRKAGRKITRSELERARQRCDAVGRLGEELINGYFTEQRSIGAIEEYEWVSADNAVSPFDFSVKQGERSKAEVKSTCGDFSQTLHISIGELIEIQGDVKYDLYRVYALDDHAHSAKLRIAKNLKPFANCVLQHLSSLPEGVAVDSVSVRPNIDILDFGPEITIDLRSRAAVPPQSAG